MANVWETFTDSYLKKLKRPELQGIFNPDQSYGANMLFRSEETNPWAGRDQSNAKFGPMGASGGMKVQAPVMSPQGASGLLPPNWNLPLMPSPQQDTFHQLMGGIEAPIANIGGKIGANYIQSLLPQGFEKLSPELQGYAKELLGGGGSDVYGDLASKFGKEASTVTESGLGGYEKLAQGVAEKATEGAGDTTNLLAGVDPATMAAAAIPMLAKMFGLKGTGGDALGAATSTGIAAAQGGMNPISDIAALYSLYKFGRGLF